MYYFFFVINLAFLLLIDWLTYVHNDSILQLSFVGPFDVVGRKVK